RLLDRGPVVVDALLAPRARADGDPGVAGLAGVGLVVAAGGREALEVRERGVPLAVARRSDRGVDRGSDSARGDGLGAGVLRPLAADVLERREADGKPGARVREGVVEGALADRLAARGRVRGVGQAVGPGVVRDDRADQGVEDSGLAGVAVGVLGLGL